MNKITTNTIALWLSILLANLWFMNGDSFIGFIWLIGALLSMWSMYKEVDTK